MMRTALPWIASALLVLPTAQAEPRQAPFPSAVGAVLTELQTALALTPPQQAQFARAMAVTRQVMPDLRAGHQALFNATQEELAHDVPDLAALAAQRDATLLADLALRQRARGEWLTLYDQFTPEQVAVLRAELHRRAGQFDALRALLPGLVPAPAFTLI